MCTIYFHSLFIEQFSAGTLTISSVKYNVQELCITPVYIQHEGTSVADTAQTADPMLPLQEGLE